jgi:hypothetical protein
MRALEFLASTSPDGSILLPPEVASQIGKDHDIKVIVLVPDDEERAWAQFGMDQFAKGYAPSDAIYDDLRTG